MVIKAVKKLSGNDLGVTGSHQSGILIPKFLIRNGFFPALDPLEYNPRISIPMTGNGIDITVNLIFYNSRLHGNQKGRCEYRLTCIGQYLKIQGLEVNDELVFEFNDKRKNYTISNRRKNNNNGKEWSAETPLVIHSGWYVSN